MKEYLGDAVYAEVDSFGALVLTTENGLRATNTIALEPEVLAALVEYIERRKAESGGQPGSNPPSST